MLPSHLLSSFPDTYILSTSSPGCKGSSCSIVFLFSSPFAYDLHWFTSRMIRVYYEGDSPVIYPFDNISAIVVFWLLWDTLFNFFSFMSTCLMVSPFNIPKYLQVSFSSSVLINTLFCSSTPSVVCCLLLFITSMAHFSMPNSIPISWLYILTICIRVFFFRF